LARARISLVTPTLNREELDALKASVPILEFLTAQGLKVRREGRGYLIILSVGKWGVHRRDLRYDLHQITGSGLPGLGKVLLGRNHCANLDHSLGGVDEVNDVVVWLQNQLSVAGQLPAGASSIRQSLQGTSRPVNSLRVLQGEFRTFVEGHVANLSFEIGGVEGAGQTLQVADLLVGFAGSCQLSPMWRIRPDPVSGGRRLRGRREAPPASGWGRRGWDWRLRLGCPDYTRGVTEG
jgi:hypothetical protein